MTPASGFEAKNGRSVPVIEGVVVLQRDEAVLLEAWVAFAAQKEEKAAKAREKKVGGSAWVWVGRCGLCFLGGGGETPKAPAFSCTALSIDCHLATHQILDRWVRLLKGLRIQQDLKRKYAGGGAAAGGGGRASSSAAAAASKPAKTAMQQQKKRPRAVVDVEEEEDAEATESEDEERGSGK